MQYSHVANHEHFGPVYQSPDRALWIRDTDGTYSRIRGLTSQVGGASPVDLWFERRWVSFRKGHTTGRWRYEGRAASFRDVSHWYDAITHEGVDLDAPPLKPGDVALATAAVGGVGYGLYRIGKWALGKLIDTEESRPRTGASTSGSGYVAPELDGPSYDDRAYTYGWEGGRRVRYLPNGVWEYLD